MMYGDSESLVATWKLGRRRGRGWLLLDWLCGVVLMGGRLEIFETQGLGRGFIAAMACPLARWWWVD
jgi:hypothetical protein